MNLHDLLMYSKLNWWETNEVYENLSAGHFYN